MTNNLVLPLLALVLAILAALFPLKREDPQGPFRSPDVRSGSILSGIVVLIFFLATTMWPATFRHGASISIALAIGAIIGLVAAWAPPGRSTLVFGLSVLGAALLHLPFIDAAEIGSCQVAFLTGAFISAFATSGLKPQLSGGYLAAISSVFVISADFLGRAESGLPGPSTAGVVLGIGFLASAVIVGVIARFSASPLVRGGIGFVILVLVGYLACRQYLASSDLSNLWLGGAVVGGVVHLLLAGEAKPEPFRFVLSAIIWLGAATVAFGIDRDYGMAVSMLAGISVLMILGSPRALMTVSVASSILIYRIFRELHPDDAKALDIGQHYTIIGIAMGALLPLLPIEWQRSNAGRSLAGWKAPAGVALWIIILLAIPIPAAVLLGAKGAIGLVVGFSFAAVVEGLRGSEDLAPVGIATGLGALTVLSYDWLGPWSDLERGVKIRAVVAVAVVLTILAAALFGLSRPQANSPETK